jgi:hypothetical protein
VANVHTKFNKNSGSNSGVVICLRTITPSWAMASSLAMTWWWRHQSLHRIMGKDVMTDDYPPTSQLWASVTLVFLTVGNQEVEFALASTDIPNSMKIRSVVHSGVISYMVERVARKARDRWQHDLAWKVPQTERLKEQAHKLFLPCDRA